MINEFIEAALTVHRVGHNDLKFELLFNSVKPFNIFNHFGDFLIKFRISFVILKADAIDGDSRVKSCSARANECALQCTKNAFGFKFLILVDTPDKCPDIVAAPSNPCPLQNLISKSQRTKTSMMTSVICSAF